MDTLTTPSSGILGVFRKHRTAETESDCEELCMMVRISEVSRETTPAPTLMAIARLCGCASALGWAWCSGEPAGDCAWDLHKSKRSWTKSSSHLAAPMFGVRLERNVPLLFREGSLLIHLWHYPPNLVEQFKIRSLHEHACAKISEQSGVDLFKPSQTWQQAPSRGVAAQPINAN